MVLNDDSDSLNCSVNCWVTNEQITDSDNITPSEDTQQSTKYYDRWCCKSNSVFDNSTLYIFPSIQYFKYNYKIILGIDARN